MGIHNFNFASKFFKNSDFHPQILHFRRKFSAKKKIVRQFFNSPKFRGRDSLRPVTTPLMM